MCWPIQEQTQKLQEQTKEMREQAKEMKEQIAGEVATLREALQKLITKMDV